MTTLKNGEHTYFTSENGITYWVMNFNNKYRVERRGSYRVVAATKEIRDNVRLA